MSSQKMVTHAFGRNGTREATGFADLQVKIRGFQIELGEIEARLRECAQVKEAVVLAREDSPGEKRLVAYVVPRITVVEEGTNDGRPSAESLRANLNDTLPEYMVPSAFVMLEKLPLTANGKVNRRALPAPDLDAYVNRHYEGPVGEIEETLTNIWQELLHLQNIGRHDNFFELGGHSLLAMRGVEKINRVFGSALKVADAYKSPTTREMASRLSGDRARHELVNLSQEALLEPAIRATAGLYRVPEQAILLTGCTGFVGRFLLAQLLRDTGATLYCLVRARSPKQAAARLVTTLKKWDLWSEAHERRIVAIPGDLRLPRLGLDEVTYRNVCQQTGSIYHCGTSMNHLETYAMAKPANVGSAREVLKLATHLKPKQVNYISTLGVFSPATTAAARVLHEESAIDSEKHWSSHGYAASKWVGEKIFMTAAERGIACNIFRLGLVWADTQQGRYDELQQVYRIFKSCLLSGVGIRNFRHGFPLTPVDYVARSVVFLANQHREGQRIFHISAPQQMSDGVFERCNAIGGTSLTLMSFYDWISEMKKLHQEGRSLPAVPLIEYAFSMSESSFHEYRRPIESSRMRVDCTRTLPELEQAGIVAPVLDDDLLRVLLRSMLSRDAELRHGQVSMTAPGAIGAGS